MAKHVLIVDVDRLQEYVFATHRLREIRGASALLSQVEERIKEDVEGAVGAVAGASVTWLTPSGGTLRAAVTGYPQTADLAGLASLFLEMTSLSTAAAHVEQVDGGEEIGEALNRAEKALRAKKSSEVRAPWFPSHPLFRLCELCGQFPAMTAVPSQEWDAPPRLLCDACLAKFSSFGHMGQHPGSYSSGPVAVAREACARASAAEGIPSGTTFETPGSFRGLVKRTRGDEDEAGDERDEDAERRYMGVICADANGMGEAWKGLCCDALLLDADYRDVSEGIVAATEGGLAEAVSSTLQARWENDERKRQEHLAANGKLLPFIPLIVGGDDVACVVPGSWALEVAHRFCREFVCRVTRPFAAVDHEADRPAMSAGVVICKHKFPIQLALDLGKQLLRSAKKRCRELVADGHRDPGAIDFAVVSESGASSLESMRQAHLTERPYLVSAVGGCLPLDALTRAAAQLMGAEGDAKVPRGKWKDLDRLLRIGNPGRRAHEYREWFEGLSKHQKGTWRIACDSLALLDPAGDLEAGTPLHERQAGQGTRTGLVDLIEILDILGKGG